jgi:hypothetical protein
MVKTFSIQNLAIQQASTLAATVVATVAEAGSVTEVTVSLPTVVRSPHHQH